MPVLDISYDASEWKPLLEAWTEPEVTKTLRKASSAWGAGAKPAIRAAVPVADPGNTYVSRGNLQRMVRARRIRKRGIGVVVGPIGKLAFYAQMVSGGTKPHLILPKKRGFLRIGNTYAKAVQHPGARPNPFIENARSAAESAGHDRAERFILRALEARAQSEATTE